MKVEPEPGLSEVGEAGTKAEASAGRSCAGAALGAAEEAACQKAVVKAAAQEARVIQDVEHNEAVYDHHGDGAGGILYIGKQGLEGVKAKLKGGKDVVEEDVYDLASPGKFSGRRGWVTPGSCDPAAGTRRGRHRRSCGGSTEAHESDTLETLPRAAQAAEQRLDDARMAAAIGINPSWLALRPPPA